MGQVHDLKVMKNRSKQKVLSDSENLIGLEVDNLHDGKISASAGITIKYFSKTVDRRALLRSSCLREQKLLQVAPEAYFQNLAQVEDFRFANLEWS